MPGDVLDLGNDEFTPKQREVIHRKWFDASFSFRESLSDVVEDETVAAIEQSPESVES